SEHRQRALCLRGGLAAGDLSYRLDVHRPGGAAVLALLERLAHQYPHRQSPRAGCDGHSGRTRAFAFRQHVVVSAPRRISMQKFALGGAILVAFGTGGCIGVSQGGGGAAAAPTQFKAHESLKVCKNGVRVAANGLIDDFEDGNTQMMVMEGRDGYWWKAHDPNGSTIGPEDSTPVEQGVNGSLAIYMTGQTSSEEGAWGVNFG